MGFPISLWVGSPPDSRCQKRVVKGTSRLRKAPGTFSRSWKVQLPGAAEPRCFQDRGCYMPPRIAVLQPPFLPRLLLDCRQLGSPQPSLLLSHRLYPQRGRSCPRETTKGHVPVTGHATLPSLRHTCHSSMSRSSLYCHNGISPFLFVCCVLFSGNVSPLNLFIFSPCAFTVPCAKQCFLITPMPGWGFTPMIPGLGG